jgi:hypothetical protein
MAASVSGLPHPPMQTELLINRDPYNLLFPQFSKRQCHLSTSPSEGLRGCGSGENKPPQNLTAESSACVTSPSHYCADPGLLTVHRHYPASGPRNLLSHSQNEGTLLALCSRPLAPLLWAPSSMLGHCHGLSALSCAL